MDLRQLSYLVAVGDEGGIRAAARRLHISQPQISQALRRLERELGVELMRRSARGIELTAEGEELVAHGREILDRVGAARSALRRMAQQQSATLRLGLVAGVLSAGELLAPILAAYRSAHPEVSLHVEDLGMNDQITPLLRGDVDVAIVRLPVEHPDLAVSPIATEPRVVTVAAGHELAAEESVHVDDVLDLPMLPLAARPEWADFWQLNAERGRSGCDETIAPARTVAEAQLAIGTRSVIVTSPAAMGRLAPNPFVRAVPLTGAAPTVIAVAHKRRDARRAIREFAEAAQATAHEHIGLLPGGAVPG
jgi:DNA-binding transcriptional LysR family regulator